MIGKLIVYSLIGFVLYFVGDVLYRLDLNKRVYNHRPGFCQKVKGLDHGSEHVEYVEKEKIAFLSSGVQALFEENGPKGAIYLYNFSDTDHKAIKLTIENEPTDFIPHGMGHYYLNGKLHLIVISHTSFKKGFQHRIEILEFNKEKQSLSYVKTIKDKSFIKPNGLHAVGPEQFFFTNDGYYQSEILGAFEMLFKIKGGSVYYYDGKESHALISSEQTPNGIWADVKRKVLYYSSPLGEFIKVIKLSEDLKSVKGELAHVPLLTSPDNLFMDDEGALWTGAHPVLYKIGDIQACFEVAGKPKPSPPPSQVLRLKFSEDFKTHELTEPYTDDGRQIPCSSHVVIDGKGNMLIGSVGLNAVHCKYTPETINAH